MFPPSHSKSDRSPILRNINTRNCFILFITVILLVLAIPSASAQGAEYMNEPEWNSEGKEYLISNLTELNWIRNAPKEDYRLIDDINATETRNWNNGKGWKPVGEENYEFYGSFDGQNHRVINLTMNRPDEEYVSMFGITGSDAVIEKLKILNFSLDGGDNSGSLVGQNHGKVKNVKAIGTARFNEGNSGGLIGSNTKGEVLDSHTIIDIEGESEYDELTRIGGLIGYLRDGSIKNSSSDGSIDVKGSLVGGLVGYSFSSPSIVNSNSSASIYAVQNVGGLVGYNDHGDIRKSYSSGEVSGDKEIGGLVGNNNEIIKNSYSSSNVEGNRSVGGLVGYNNDEGDIENSYSVGEVTGDQYAGGLVGWDVGTVEESFWNTESSGLDTSDAGKGKNTGEMNSLWAFTESTNFSSDNTEIKFNEKGEKRNVTLNSNEYTIEYLNSQVNDPRIPEIEGTFLIEGKEYRLNLSETIILEPAQLPISIGGYSGTYSTSDDGNAELDSITLDFHLDPNWDIAEVDTTQDINQSYTWNIVDGESYPFLSWEGSAGDAAPDRHNLTVKVEDNEGKALENASVKIDSYDEETDEGGEAFFEDLIESDYTAIVDKEGYHENSVQFSLDRSDQNGTAVLEQLSSEFSITNINLSSDNVDKGETVEANITVNNTGLEKGRRDVSLRVGEQLIGTKETDLESETSEKLSFDFSVDEEGEFDVTAEIFEDSRSKDMLVGPKKYDLELGSTPVEAGSLTPETGIYTYEEGEAVTVDATAKPGWKFKEWNGLDKETNEVTLTMNEDKSIEALFEEDIDVSIEEVSVPQTVDGEIDFNYQIANQQEEITDTFTVRLNGREVSKTEKTVSQGENLNEDGPTVNPLAGDGSENAKLEIEYAGVKDSRSFRIASVQREFVEEWNYFSLPIATSQTMNVEEIFDQDEINTIWTYENGWKNYYPEAPDNQFDTIRGGQGYIVEAEEDFSITPIVETNLSMVESNDPVKPAQNNLDAGWNLIGSYWTTGIEASDTGAYSSLPDDHVTSTLHTDNDGSLSLEELGDENIEPGKAYWISSKDKGSYTKSRRAE